MQGLQPATREAYLRLAALLAAGPTRG
jgi:hypothetical protein